jgi:chromosome segregation ATPase
MLTITGVILIFGTVVNIAVMLWCKRTLTWHVISAIGVIGVAGGFAIANINVITSLKVTPGSLSADIQQKAEHVDVKAAEVDALAKKVQTLADDVKDAKTQIDIEKSQVAALVDKAAKTESNVRETDANLRKAGKTMIEANMILADGLSNASVLRGPLFERLRSDVDTLSSFVFPDASERNREMEKLRKEMDGGIWNAPKPPATRK